MSTSQSMKAMQDVIESLSSFPTGFSCFSFTIEEKAIVFYFKNSFIGYSNFLDILEQDFEFEDLLYTAVYNVMTNFQDSIIFNFKLFSDSGCIDIAKRIKKSILDLEIEGEYLVPIFRNDLADIRLKNIPLYIN